jgi:ERCC4-type nuclease
MHKDLQISITLKKDCNVLPVANLQEVPALLKDLAYTTTHPQSNQFTSAKSLPTDAASKQLHLLTLIPNVGRKKGQILLEKFGHFKRISYATEDELAAVIGVTAAKSIYDFFHKAVVA